MGRAINNLDINSRRFRSIKKAFEKVGVTPGDIIIDDQSFKELGIDPGLANTIAQVKKYWEMIV
ncbi:hypothetical protein SANA_01260 [Gottschalkiaceae bacterium SANA]|nr:hypothetical protein SANA_01260 [Gottschalkiaceae bacterium SANA]